MAKHRFFTVFKSFLHPPLLLRLYLLTKHIHISYAFAVLKLLYLYSTGLPGKSCTMKLSQAIAFAANNEHFLKFLDLQNLKAEEAHALTARVLKEDDNNIWIKIMADYGRPGINTKDITVKVHYSRQTNSFTFDQVARL